MNAEELEVPMREVGRDVCMILEKPNFALTAHSHTASSAAQLQPRKPADGLQTTPGATLTVS